jgi:hypothetical protein
MKRQFFILFILALVPEGVMADGGSPGYKADLDYAQVIFVRASQQPGGHWSFETTVRHNDEGWQHYADAWQVVNPSNDEVIAERVLAHPHVGEQPFTRSLGNIAVPPSLKSVVVRARCNVHGFGGREIELDLTVGSGEGFKVLSLRN